MRLQAAVSSHVGLIRENNEDNFFLRGSLRQDLLLKTLTLCHKGDDRLALFAVADGMGGQENGELASLVTVQNLCPGSIDRAEELARQSILMANDLICEEIRASGAAMGSTLAALYVDRGRALCCNLGDSRVYRYRGGTLTQLSRDHTQVQQMVSAGILTPEQARTHKRRHVLTQNVGIFPEEATLEPWFSEILDLAPGDVFLLCTDGLTDMADDGQISQVLSAGGTAQAMADGLVQLALDRGGKDNVTVLAVQVLRGFSLFSRHGS